MQGIAFLEIGDWDERAVSAKWEPHVAEPARPPELQSLIETGWREVVASMAGRVQLFDGPMCRLNRYRANADALQLELSPTSYRTFFGTNMQGPAQTAGFERHMLANALGMAAAVVSSDGWLLLGGRGERVAYHANRLHPFAGSVEPPDDGATSINVFAEIRRELNEELRLAPGDITTLRCAAVAMDETLRQPELIFIASARADRSSLEASLDADEHRGVYAISVNEAAMQDALSDEQLTPVARGAVLMLGRQRFGAGWFDRAAAPYIVHADASRRTFA